MTNEELIKALRYCGDGDCENCKYRYDGLVNTDECKLDIIHDSADAIEALIKLVDQNTKRCEELRKQLREAHESYEKHLAELSLDNKMLKNTIDADKGVMLNRIRFLEAQIPKQGEWISGYDGFEWEVRCSVCGEEALIKEGGSHDHAYSNYCPNCGAKMDGKEQNDE